MCTLLCYWLQRQQSSAVFDHQLLVPHQNWIRKKKKNLSSVRRMFPTASSPGSEFLTCCWASEGVCAPSCDNRRKVQVWIDVSVSVVCGCEQGVTHFYSPPSTFKNLSRQEPAAQLWLSHRTAWIQTRRTWSWERDSWWKGWDIYVK